MKNDVFVGKKSKNRKLYHRKNIKTQTEDVALHQHPRINQHIHQKCQSFLQAVNNICMNSKSKPHILNISIPVSLTNKSKGENFQARMNKFKDYFIAKLRRKQQARSKILLQRMEREGRSVSLIQLSQKWLQSSKPPELQKDRAETIKQMKLKVKKRNQFSFSESKIKPQNHHYLSRLCNV